MCERLMNLRVFSTAELTIRRRDPPVPLQLLFARVPSPSCNPSKVDFDRVKQYTDIMPIEINSARIVSVPALSAFPQQPAAQLLAGPPRLHLVIQRVHHVLIRRSTFIFLI